MTYTSDDPVEITLGVCDGCSAYVPFVRLITKDDISSILNSLPMCDDEGNNAGVLSCLMREEDEVIEEVLPVLRSDDA